MKKFVLAVLAAAVVFATPAEARRRGGPKTAAVTCPARMDRHDCVYYKAGYILGNDDRAAHLSNAYLRHADLYDRRFERAFKAGYEKARGAPAMEKSEPSAASAGQDSTPAPMSRRQQVCQKEVAAIYGAQASQISLGVDEQTGDGTYDVQGTVDKGAEGKKPFRCNFDKNEKFTGVMSAATEEAR